jgi:pSer/pThr/pTyr-binding forkhead associated (FHA) protein
MTNKYLLKRVNDGEKFSLTFASLLVGRSDSCDIRVLTGQASREHARIRAQNDGALVEDLHSTNGTYVNDKKIETATLIKPGDVVRFDQESFSLHREDANETIYARPINPNARGGMSIEEQDEEDTNATVYRQSYVMPPGWQGFDNESAGADMDERKRQALDNFINKSFRALKGDHVIAFIFSKDDEPPIIKTVAAENKEQRWSLGRNHHCDIVVEQPDISDVHCHLIFDAGNWSLEDNQSTNGLWHNNKKQVSISLNDGINLHIASLKLNVRIENRG